MFKFFSIIIYNFGLHDICMYILNIKLFNKFSDRVTSETLRIDEYFKSLLRQIPG